METNFTLTTTTSNFISALKTLRDFRENYLNALCALYGDEQGANLYEDELKLVKAVESRLGNHMIFSMTENIGVRGFNGEI